MAHNWVNPVVIFLNLGRIPLCVLSFLLAILLNEQQKVRRWYIKFFYQNSTGLHIKIMIFINTMPCCIFLLFLFWLTCHQIMQGKSILFWMNIWFFNREPEAVFVFQMFVPENGQFNREAEAVFVPQMFVPENRQSWQRVGCLLFQASRELALTRTWFSLQYRKEICSARPLCFF